MSISSLSPASIGNEDWAQITNNIINDINTKGAPSTSPTLTGTITLNGDVLGSGVSEVGATSKIVKTNSSGVTVLSTVNTTNLQISGTNIFSRVNTWTSNNVFNGGRLLINTSSDDGINPLQVNGDINIVSKGIVLAGKEYINSSTFNTGSTWTVATLGDKAGLYMITWYIADDNFFSDGCVLYQNYLNNAVITVIRENTNSFWKGTGNLFVTGGVLGSIILNNTTNGSGGMNPIAGTVKVKIIKLS